MQAPNNLDALFHILGCGGLAAFTSLLSVVVLNRLNTSQSGAGDRMREDIATAIYPLTMAAAAMLIGAEAFDQTTRITLAGAYIFAPLAGPILMIVVRSVMRACLEIEALVDRLHVS